MDQNQLRTVDGLVGIDGWVSSDRAGEFSLHVDVNFHEARLGGVDDFELSFRVKMKQCEVVVIIPGQSEMAIDKASVDLSPPAEASHNRSAEILQSLTDAERKSLMISDDLFDAAMKMQGLKAKMETIPIIYAQHGKTIDNHYCWRLSPHGTTHLKGPVWDARGEPRMKIQDKRSKEQKLSDEKNELCPAASIEIRCKREDIDIYDIRLSDGEENDKVSDEKHDVRLAAVEGYLREMLLRTGLKAGSMSDIFGDLTIADYVMQIKE